MKRLLLALQFLTIIPVRVAGEVSLRDLSRSAAFFPAAGALQGLIAGGTALLGLRFFPPDVAAGLAVLALVMGNGGFDLDGLADTCDGLAVKSCGDPSADREKRLSVMKQSTTGTIGVIAVVLAILLKFLFISAVLRGLTPAAAFGIIVLTPVLSKWVTVPAMYLGKPARQDGLGRIFIDHTDAGITAVATALAAALAVIVTSVWIRPASGPILFPAALMAGLFLFCLMAVRFFGRAFGGLTGDSFGALTEVSELLCLATAYPWLRHSF